MHIAAIKVSCRVYVTMLQALTSLIGCRKSTVIALAHAVVQVLKSNYNMQKVA